VRGVARLRCGLRARDGHPTGSQLDPLPVAVTVAAPVVVPVLLPATVAVAVAVAVLVSVRRLIRVTGGRRRRPGAV
jgi:hypothetical protein